MNPHVSPATVFRFGVFELDARRGELRKYGLKIRIGQQALKLLLALLQSPGQLVSREELGEQLLPAVNFTDFEHSLNKAICQLRQALGDSASSPRYIETIANQGYRFIPLPENESQPPAHAHRRRRFKFIAVLPLAAKELVEPEVGFFASQLVCQLINKLSSTPRLRVLAYNKVKQHADAHADPQSIGRDLGVQGVVAAEILRHDENVTIELELIDVGDGAQFWGMQLAQPWPEAASNAGQIVDQIVCELQPILALGRNPVQTDPAKQDAPPKTLRDAFLQMARSMPHKTVI
jgi:DNA-binding winged helix-turn-helix (wHTH) protein